ncbi:transposable element Tcb1 transposase [Trichonephila clavipes]|nr:transposable element Tcb1 transposase [Trichonephila clavipes]
MARLQCTENGMMSWKDEILSPQKNMEEEILKENSGTSAEKLGIEEDYQFYQDNDPKHSTYNSRLWLLYNCPKIIKTLAQSPDLNPIEHQWSILEKRLSEHHFSQQNSNGGHP